MIQDSILNLYSRNPSPCVDMEKDCGKSRLRSYAVLKYCIRMQYTLCG